MCIRDRLTILEQKYPGGGKKPASGECVDAASAGMAGDASKLMKFPSFNGKDLDGNDVNLSLIHICEIVLNPTLEQRAKTDLNLTVASTADLVAMIEAGGNSYHKKIQQSPFYPAESLRP